VAIRLPPRRRRLPAPAPDLAPQSFGRYVNGNFQASVLLGGLSLLLAGTAFLIARKFGGLVFVTVFYGLLALSGLLFRDTWVAGGDGWLVLLRGREQLAWVRTGRLAHVSLEPRHPGDSQLQLVLRDNDGREHTQDRRRRHNGTWSEPAHPRKCRRRGIQRGGILGVQDERRCNGVLPPRSS
jgi:hypothetical protein